MKIKALICLLTTLTVLLCSCVAVQKSLSESSEMTPSYRSVSFDENEQKILRVMEAGKRFVAELQNEIEPSNKSEEQNNEAREAFGRYLNLDTLYVSGVFLDPNTPSTYTCMISGYNEYNYARSVDVIFTAEGEQLLWFCPMVHYYKLSDSVLEHYLNFLQNNDADGLAKWLGMDGLPSEAMIYSAIDTVNYYRSFCDFSKLSVRENEYGLLYDVYIEGFIYTIEDANGGTFQVETSFGDGHCYPILHCRYY